MSDVFLILPSGRALRLARPLTDAERDELLQAENAEVLDRIAERLAKRQAQPDPGLAR